ncbi:TIM-barrel domain-containing protein [Winogradskyella sp. PG-2]|uniref:TIM-barrel domain-containing protein n=1 Tax=Winogradskyella sp. PG-2 TaxID=754409 RepID=UPI0004587CCB|nr:TIM-barrel domain-containing protein [Winogradskyella sp. PG-2]BAO76006.1 alpha-glucosidase [Winogradskyella sp. PG-2]
MKHILLYISVLLFTVTITAQNANRIFKSAQVEGLYVKVTVNDGYYIINPYSSTIIETTFVPNGEMLNSESHAVVLSPSNSTIEINERANDILINTNGELYITITKSPFQISYYYKDKLITSEKQGYHKSKHELMDMVKGNIVADSTEKIEFNLTKGEVLYGGGARALGMNRRGNRLPLYNRAHYGYETRSELMNFTLPIVLSSNQYMIHFDNAPVGYLDLDSKGDNSLTYETIYGRKTYQVIVGETWYDIINNYTILTGKQPMLPRWALGNFSSRFGYHSQEEVEMTIDKFKEEEIAVDAVILDLFWFGKEIQGTLGNFEFYRDSFPEPIQMIKTLKAKNVETILITEPYVLTTSKRWDEAVKADILAKDSIGKPAVFDFYFGNGGIIDIYSPKGEQWFKNIYKGLSDYGVNGFWGDLGEPEVLPSWVNFESGTADEFHNIYGHDWAKLVYEASLESNPNRRPFVLMRAGYSGSQRYGMVPWSGDVNRTWGGFQSQPEIALQMGMQGLAYMHSDLGGFAGDNLDDELYLRWLQYGVFNPIFRPHAQESVASEPVFRSEKTKALANEAIELRYKLLEYNYNLVYQNNQFGKPLMRPLFFEEPENKDLFNYSKTYLWGNDILVSPVLEADITEQEIYFPKDNVWFDFYTDERFEGGQTRTVSLKENSIPTYVRAGAFIPISKPVPSTKEYNSSLKLHYYFDITKAETEQYIYSDNGSDTNAIENNAYEVLEFESKYKGTKLEFEFEYETELKERYGDLMTIVSGKKSIHLIIHKIPREPKYIKVNGRKVSGKWDSKSKTISVSGVIKPSEALKIKIKLKR